LAGDTNSRVLNPDDIKTYPLFGEGAGPCSWNGPPDRGILAYSMGSEGSGGPLLQREAGGSRNPPTPQQIAEANTSCTWTAGPFSAGPSIFSCDTIQDVLKAAGFHFGCEPLRRPTGEHPHHQRAIDVLNIPRSKVFNNLEKYGNTSPARFPSRSMKPRRGTFEGRRTRAALGFGAGLAWGNRRDGGGETSGVAAAIIPCMSDSSRRLVGLLSGAIVGAGAYFAWPREKPPALNRRPSRMIPMTSSAIPRSSSIYKSVEPDHAYIGSAACAGCHAANHKTTTHGTQQGSFGREPCRRAAGRCVRTQEIEPQLPRLSQGRPASPRGNRSHQRRPGDRRIDVPVRYLVGSGHFLTHRISSNHGSASLAVAGADPRGTPRDVVMATFSRTPDLSSKRR